MLAMLKFASQLLSRRLALVKQDQILDWKIDKLNSKGMAPSFRLTASD
jgi:hypothetical protein